MISLFFLIIYMGSFMLMLLVSDGAFLGASGFSVCVSWKASEHVIIKEVIAVLATVNSVPSSIFQFMK